MKEQNPNPTETVASIIKETRLAMATKRVRKGSGKWSCDLIRTDGGGRMTGLTFDTGEERGLSPTVEDVLSAVVLRSEDLRNELRRLIGDERFEKLAKLVRDAKLEELRGDLRKGRLSYLGTAEIADLTPHIAPGDVELLEAAGVPEDRAEDHVAWYNEQKRVAGRA